MPIVTITVRKPKTAAFKSTILDAVHAALVEAGVNANDRFHRVLELGGEDFRFDPTFPDLRSPRDDSFVLIEILLGVGRSVRVKKKIIGDAMERLSRSGIDPEHVMIVFQDVAYSSASSARQEYGLPLPHQSSSAMDDLACVARRL